MNARLEWSNERFSTVGRAGGFRLFSVTWGTKRQDAMWSLNTDLPIRGPALGQHYASKEEAKAAAEKMLAAFLKRIAGESA